MKIFHKFTNEADGVSAIIVESTHKAGGYAVVLRDDDAGETVSSIHGYRDMDKAVAAAQSLVSGECAVGWVPA